MQSFREREPDIPLFHQAAEAIVRSIWPVLDRHPTWDRLEIVERLLRPDREVRFRIDWIDDEGSVRVDEGWRIQHSNLLGPYKGGLRFTPELDRSTLRFLALEQAFKGALTGMPLGGAKGGATFDRRGRSEGEVMRFCQAFMARLAAYIGPHLDVPAGDMNVGTRELGYLYGAYRRLTGNGRGGLTGKPVDSGGIPLRMEATGYGVVYVVHEALLQMGHALEGKTAAVSGAGNVALHAAEKLIVEGARVIALSDTSGTLHLPDGLDEAGLARIRAAKAKCAHLNDVAEEVGGVLRSTAPWCLEPEIALPCATQNELDRTDATALVRAGTLMVAEGANMPCTTEAIAVLERGGVQRLPGKLANAGGVTVSSFEMAQNAQLVPWNRAKVDRMLRERMCAMHQECVENGMSDDGELSYERGANVTAFLLLGEAMAEQGVV